VPNFKFEDMLLGISAAHEQPLHHIPENKPQLASQKKTATPSNKSHNRLE